MSRHEGQVALILTGLAVVAALALALAVRGSLGKREAPRAVEPAVEAKSPDAVASTPAVAKKAGARPLFRTPEQHWRYYEAVLAGERRALAAVDDALTKARTAGAEAAHLGKLEAMRAEYLRRIRKHEADRHL